MAHLLYIPLTLVVGIYIGYQLGREAERQDREKRKKVQQARQ